MGCRKVGERAYCKDQLPRGGGLSVLPILRVCSLSCGATHGVLLTPPTAVRWDPRQLQRGQAEKVCTFASRAMAWPVAVSAKITRLCSGSQLGCYFRSQLFGV